MQRPIRPAWLIRQAYELAGEGAGQPRNADLRRAVSAAYYALYHQFCICAANHLIPAGSQETRFRLTRNFQHNAVRQVCDWIASPSNPPANVGPTVLELRANTRVRDIAIAFQTLIEARHEADYDHMADFTRAETISLVDLADDAIATLNAIRGSRDYQALMAFVAFKSNVR